MTVQKQIGSGIFLGSALLIAAAGCAPLTETRVKSSTSTEKTKAPFSARQPAKILGINAQNPSIAQMETAVWKRINGQRQKQGLKELARNATLTQVARAYSRRMSEERFFSHFDPQGKSAADRVRAAGVSYQVVGENLFLSRNAPDTLQVVVNGWMKSPEHRQNILTAEYSETGVGIWKRGQTYLVTQIFIRPS